MRFGFPVSSKITKVPLVLGAFQLVLHRRFKEACLSADVVSEPIFRELRRRMNSPSAWGIETEDEHERRKDF